MFFQLDMKRLNMICDRWIQEESQTLESHLEHCSGSYTLSEMQQSVSVQATWRVHLTNECRSILKSEEGSRCNLLSQNVNITVKAVVLPMWLLMFDLVLAVIIRLKMFHMKSIIWRTNSTKVEHMTDLEVKIRDSNIFKKWKDLHKHHSFTQQTV